MKRFIAVILLTFCSLSVFAQTNEDKSGTTKPLIFCSPLIFVQSDEVKPESVAPMRDIEITRNVSQIDIEGEIFHDVKVEIQSIIEDYPIPFNDTVHVKMSDKQNKIFWRRTWNKVCLYVFSNGQLQIGRPNFNKIVIYKPSLDSKYIGVVREYEGVY